MKRAKIAPAILFLSAAFSLSFLGCDQSGGKPRIGVALLNFNDGIVGTARRALETEAQGKAALAVLDGRSQQKLQNDQVDALVIDKAKSIIVNPVDPSALASLAIKARSAGISVVFFTRDPSMPPVDRWYKAYFVGAKAEEIDALQVEILADYWKAHPDMDKNRDGRLQYAVIRGDSASEASQADDEIRHKAFEAVRIKAVKVADALDEWTRAEAPQQMAALIDSFGSKKPEALLCASDEIALDAIEALKAAGYFKDSGGSFIPVIGADGARGALDAISDGSLLGTVRVDAASQGRAAFDLAYALAMGRDPGAAGWALVDSRFVFVPCAKVTRDNLKDFPD